MITEKSCGAIVFARVENSLRYVIVESKSGVCGFPKGHVEPGETEEQTALREVWEETNLCIKLIHGFREEIRYSFNWNEKIVDKQVIYYLGECGDQLPVPQIEELNRAEFMDYDAALSVLAFDDAKTLLVKANAFLSDNYKAEN